MRKKWNSSKVVKNVVAVLATTEMSVAPALTIIWMRIGLVEVFNPHN